MRELPEQVPSTANMASLALWVDCVHALKAVVDKGRGDCTAGTDCTAGAVGVRGAPRVRTEPGVKRLRVSASPPRADICEDEQIDRLAAKHDLRELTRLILEEAGRVPETGGREQLECAFIILTLVCTRTYLSPIVGCVSCSSRVQAHLQTRPERHSGV